MGVKRSGLRKAKTTKKRTKKRKAVVLRNPKTGEIMISGGQAGRVGVSDPFARTFGWQHSKGVRAPKSTLIGRKLANSKRGVVPHTVKYGAKSRHAKVEGSDPLEWAPSDSIAALQHLAKLFLP
jgi:hypothetical protein